MSRLFLVFLAIGLTGCLCALSYALFGGPAAAFMVPLGQA